MNDGRLAGVPLMFPVAFYRNLSRFALVASLALITSGAVAQDKAQDTAKDQSKDDAQAQQDPNAQSVPAQNKPADAVDPLKRPVTEKERRRTPRP